MPLGSDEELDPSHMALESDSADEKDDEHNVREGGGEVDDLA